MIIVNARIKEGEDYFDNIRPTLRLHTLGFDTNNPFVIDLLHDGHIAASFYFSKDEMVDIFQQYLKLSLQK